MSAWVDETTRFEATCNQCSWWGPERYNPDEAEEDSDEHDREKHPNATPYRSLAQKRTSE